VNYILFIYVDEKDWVDTWDDNQAEVMAQHEKLEADLRQTGKYRGCGGLHPVGTATTLRREGSEVVVTDGPYAETREQLGGYYIVDAADLDDALEIAKRIPLPAHAKHAGVEIRPVADIRHYGEGGAS